MTLQQNAEVHLELTKVTAGGKSLGLRAGDKLVGLDGEPFTAGARAMAARFSNTGTKRVVLHFQRGDMDLSVISVTPRLGRWTACPVVGTRPLPQINPNKIDNWEIMRNRDGVYDLFRQRPPITTWLLTPFWMAEMRLWPHLAGFAGLVAVGYPAGIWISATLWALAAYYVRKNYKQILRSDRMLRGFLPYAVIAAGSEMAAHRTYLNMEPDDSFAFGQVVRSKTPASPPTGEPQDLQPTTA